MQSLPSIHSVSARPSGHALFEASYPTLQPRLEAYARRFLPTEAEDLAQQAMLRAWSAADSFDTSRGSWAAWVYRIQRNVIYDRLRELRGQPPLIPVECLNRESVPSTSLNLDSRLETERLLHQTPPPLRRLLWAHYVEGYTAAEIAAQLNCPTGTITSTCSRARRRLSTQAPLAPGTLAA